jgi:hypothetical protein
MVIILGLNMVYLVELPSSGKETENILELNPLRPFRPIRAPIISNIEFATDSAPLFPSATTILSAFANKNYTSCCVSASGSHVLLFSKISRKVAVYNSFTAELTEICLTHFPDKAEAAFYSPCRFLLYQHEADQCIISVVNPKDSRTQSLVVSHATLCQFVQRQRFDETKFAPASTTNVSCKFFGREGSILVSMIGMVFIHKNVNFDKEQIDGCPRHFSYELVNVINVFQSLNNQFFRVSEFSGIHLVVPTKEGFFYVAAFGSGAEKVVQHFLYSRIEPGNPPSPMESVHLPRSVQIKEKSEEFLVKLGRYSVADVVNNRRNYLILVNNSPEVESDHLFISVKLK